MRRLLATAVCGAALGAAPAAWAQQTIESLGLAVTTTPLLATDYLFRGISQTRNRPAGQLSLDVQHETGLYVGGFVSNATFLGSPYNDTRQELDLLAGYRRSFGALSLDGGLIAYLYPGQTKPEGTQLNEYFELGLKAAYTLEPVKFLAAFNWSPNFFGRSGNAYYLEGGADLSLPLGFTAFGRLGYQWIQNNPRFGTPDYLWYGMGVQREIVLGVTGALGYYGTNISQNECAPVPGRADGGQKICDNRVMFSISRTF